MSKCIKKIGQNSQQCRSVCNSKEMCKGPVIIYVGDGGEKSGGGPGLFFLEKRGGPKENFTMIGGGSLCVL